MLTFDGNKAVEQKVTYERIQQHLEKKYGCHFSYGTTVELCVAHHRRRKSATRYKGAAQVTSRRARRGFQLKLQPRQPLELCPLQRVGCVPVYRWQKHSEHQS